MSEAIRRINENMSGICKRLDDDLVESAGVTVHFTLLVWDKEEWTYLSTSTDKSVIRALKTLAESYEKAQSEPPPVRLV